MEKFNAKSHLPPDDEHRQGFWSNTHRSLTEPDMAGFAEAVIASACSHRCGCEHPCQHAIKETRCHGPATRATSRARDYAS